jgi:rare lipoprotein A
MNARSATSAALAAAALAAAVALPAAASEGTGNGGASATPPPSQPAQAAQYEPVRATWYGPGFFGRRTACGTRLTHRTLGVAHRQLPCGTQVSLQFHGRTIVVPVIDRGPYSRGVTYDLTYATAQKLGMQQTSRLRAATLQY